MKVIPRKVGVLMAILILIVSSVFAIYNTITSTGKIVSRLSELTAEAENLMKKLEINTNRLKLIENYLQQNMSEISSLNFSSSIKYEELEHYLDFLLSNKLVHVKQLSILPRFEIPIFFEASDLTYDFTFIISPLDNSLSNTVTGGGM